MKKVFVLFLMMVTLCATVCPALAEVSTMSVQADVEMTYVTMTGKKGANIYAMAGDESKPVGTFGVQRTVHARFYALDDINKVGWVSVKIDGKDGVYYMILKDFTGDETELGQLLFSNKTLQQGHRGDPVRYLQETLKSAKSVVTFNGAADGIFGSATKKAVEAFQSKKSLSVDGLVGRETKAKLIPYSMLEGYYSK